jgi:hypothetical protein
MRLAGPSSSVSSPDSSTSGSGLNNPRNIFVNPSCEGAGDGLSIAAKTADAPTTSGYLAYAKAPETELASTSVSNLFIGTEFMGVYKLQHPAYAKAPEAKLVMTAKALMPMSPTDYTAARNPSRPALPAVNKTLAERTRPSGPTRSLGGFLF